MRTRLMLTSLVVALTVVPVRAAPRASVPTLPFEKHVLANGLQLVLHVDRKLPLVHLNLAYHVGSKNERPGRTGFAHLFEHLMLQGSKNAPEDYFTLMARAGAKGGRDSNGTLSRAGSTRDPVGKEGLAKLVGATMSRGTQTRSALAVEASVGDLGANMQSTVELEHAAHTLEVQRQNLASALDLIADVARHPSFPETEVIRERQLQLGALAAQEDDADSLADRLRLPLAFGAAHPYGRPVLGYRASVGGLHRADLATFHAATWRPASAALVLVGDVTLAEATQLAQRAFGSWRGAAEALPTILAAQPLANGRIVIVDKPSAAQTVAIQFFAAPAHKSEDYYALRLASEVLGTGTSGRLYANLRQAKGYSYGVGAYLESLAGGMTWYASGSVQTDKTRESVIELVSEQRGIAGARPITGEELEDARLGLLRNYAAGFDTNLDVAERVTELWAKRWPMDELARGPVGLRQATLSQVQAAAKRYAGATETSLLLVGDRSKIEGKLRALKLADVVVVDAEGHPLIRSSP